MSELNAENSKLRIKIDTLKKKVASLGGCNLVEQSQYVLKQVLQETFEREKRQTNLIAYGVPESTFLDVSLRIAHDKYTFGSLLSSHDNAVPSNIKLVHLEKLTTSSARPLKAIFDTKEAAIFHYWHSIQLNGLELFS